MPKANRDPRLVGYDDHEGKVKYIIAYCDVCKVDRVHSQSSPKIIPTCEHIFTKTHTKEEVDLLTGRQEVDVPSSGANGAIK